MQCFDAVGLGQCSLDHICRVSRYPDADVKCEVPEFSVLGGGPVATALVALQRLGLKTSFLGKIGTDTAGTAIAEGLEEEGVDISSLVRAQGRTSQTAFIIVEERKATRTIFWTSGTAFPISPGEVDLSVICNARFLHLDALNIEVSLKAAEYAGKLSIPTMVDTGTFRKETVPLLPLLNHVVVGQGFARGFAGTDDIEQSLRAMAQYGARMVCITLGERGSAAFVNGRVYHQKAFPVNVVDTTGCGDAFHGGLIYGILQEWPAERQLEFASAVAALKCRAMGGRAGLPAVPEVEEFLREKRGES
ncbi:MAG: carbohydrate kinase family protein [Candidatus Xenobiia bacterium LiM19]